jgi:acetate kinase
MVILTLNCGSSSAKYQVYDWDNKDVLAVGNVEKVTQPGSFIGHTAKGKAKVTIRHECPTHTEAVELIIKTITDPETGVIKDMNEIAAVGHRIAHGGANFTKSVVVNDKILNDLSSIVDMSPLHNPAECRGIMAAQKVLPNVPHCAVIDTAWHQTIPPENFLYAMPYEWYEKYNARRYGFHGTSYLYVAKRASVLLGRDPFRTNLIICHLGNGASMDAVKNGCSYDTSMGIAPQEGLIMGTRVGDVDVSMVSFIMGHTGMSEAEVLNAFNKKSGLLGICGKSDMRDVTESAAAGDKRSELAMTMFAQRVKKYIGAYQAELGRVDALVFAAGIGEFSWEMREKILKGLAPLGMVFDPRRNKLSHTNNAETRVSTDDSPIPIFVIPTDEELVMTEDAYALMKGTYDIHTNFHYTFQDKSYLNKARFEGLKAEIAKHPELAEIVALPA